MTPQQRVREWLEREQIPQAELARRCGYDKGNFHRMMQDGAELSTSAALRLYDATGLQLGPLDGLAKREIDTARKLAA